MKREGRGREDRGGRMETEGRKDGQRGMKRMQIKEKKDGERGGRIERGRMGRGGRRGEVNIVPGHRCLFTASR